jgi:hypothetical protein
MLRLEMHGAGEHAMRVTPNTCRIHRRRRCRTGTVQYAALFFLVIFGALGYGFYHYVILPEQGPTPQQSADEQQAGSADSSNEFARYRLSHRPTALTTGDATTLESEYGRAGSRSAGAGPQPATPDVIVAAPKEESKIVIKFSGRRSNSSGTAASAASH